MNNASIHDAIIKYLFETKWFDAQFWCSPSGHPWSTTHRVLKSHRSNMNAIYMLIYIYIYIYIYILHIYILFYITYIYRYTYTWELQARPHRRRGCHPHTFSEIVLFQWKSAFVSFSKAPNWPRHPQNPVGGLKLQIFLFNEKM